MFALAEHLKQPLDTVMKMSHLEFKGWIAYLNVKQQREKRELKKHGNRTTNHRSR